MDLEFWEQRWQQNQIAFHLPMVNPYLMEYWSHFNIKPRSQVFIPLCGKTLDLVWFAVQQYSVLGIECSNKAINEFFAEQHLPIHSNQDKDFKVYHSGNIKLLQGDFFKLNKAALKDVSVLYDRASLIALPQDMRVEYVELLNKILPACADMLLITLTYNQTLMSGPPFSVEQGEVVELYESLYNIELLHEAEVLEGHIKFKERGLDYLTERVYKLSRKT
jgi:thiopurine S-methyltransferase